MGALALVSALWGLACSSHEGATTEEPTRIVATDDDATNDEVANDPGPDETATECEPCLRSGGTWQLGDCTTNCALQDTSCFRDACPAPCAADSCGTCFGRAECEAVHCEWHSVDEAMWCTASN
ncbi:MAG TPA: hypothetical protein VJU61_25995 [Polyangiaceae bacterium]|nr:hypothetical protein [Polyangiaceae bacterium]